MTAEQEANRRLIERFPFLLPRNRMTGEVIKDYDYSFTELDELEDGWRTAFGEELCEEIAQALKKDGLLDTYRILQIKEKFGALCWYCSGGNKEVHDILEKYRKMSERICVKCGKPATRITLGWVCPYCDDCIPTWGAGEKSATMSIDKYFENIQAGRPYYSKEDE